MTNKKTQARPTKMAVAMNAAALANTRRAKTIHYLVMLVVLVIGALIGYFMANGSANNNPPAVKIVSERALPEKTCAAIEAVKLKGLINEDTTTDVWAFTTNAQVYTDLVQNGCPENADKWRAAAERDLAIADSLNVPLKEIDESHVDYVTPYVQQVRIQQQLNPDQAAAQVQQIVDTMKKIGDAAVPFITEVEKIVNEQ